MRRFCCLLPILLIVMAGCSGPTVVPDAKPLPGTETVVPAGGGTDLVPAVLGPPDDVAGDYRLAPGDVLDVKVFQADELSSRERISDAGSITLPLIGQLRVAGLTPRQAEDLISAAFAKDYLQDPQVDIHVTEFADLEVSIGGEVNKPGVFPIRGRTTLLEGIALAGGTTVRAKTEEVVVFRSTGAHEGMQAYVVNLKKVQRGELGDPLLAANDKIVVPKSGTRVFVQEARETMRGFDRFSLNPFF